MKKSRAKIAIVSDAIYPYNKGGKEKRIFEISTRLAKRGFDVHVYTMKWWETPELQRIENNVTLHAISPLYPLYSGERRSIAQAIKFSLHSFKLLKENFDVLEVDHMPHLILFPTKIVTIIKRKKLFVTWNEVWGKHYWVKYLGYIGYIAYLIERITLLLPDKFISISEHTTNKIKYFNPSAHIRTVPNGIDYEEIHKVKPAKKHYNVIFAGRFLKHKNVHMILKAIELCKKKLPNISCLLIGNGPELDQLNKQVQLLQLTNNVTFTDFFNDHKELYAHIKNAEMFVFPSEREGFGIVVIEANACGIPVITVNVKDNAAKDLIKEGVNGSVVKLSEKDISEKIHYYLTHKSNKDIISNMTKTYDWEKITDRIVEVYTT